MTAPATDAADEITERLAREFAAHARGEASFMATLGIPARLGLHLAVNALRRAAMTLEAACDRPSLALGIQQQEQG